MKNGEKKRVMTNLLFVTRTRTCSSCPSLPKVIASTVSEILIKFRLVKFKTFHDFISPGA